MCDCIKQLEEMGFVRKDSTYDEKAKDFVDVGYSIRHLEKNKSFFTLNYCPACGDKARPSPT